MADMLEQFVTALKMHFATLPDHRVPATRTTAVLEIDRFAQQFQAARRPTFASGGIDPSQVGPFARHPGSKW